MIRRLIVVALAASVAIALAALYPFAVGAQGSQFSSFSLQASNTALTLGASTTLSVNVEAYSGTPTGSIEFYQSSNPDTCALSSNVLGTVAVTSAGESSVPLTWTPTATGAFPICAVYNPGPADPYGTNTTNLVTVNVQAPVPLTTFDIGASPNPVGDGIITTLTAYLGGNAQYGTPPGTVQFYNSSSSTTCINSGNTISGQLSISTIFGADGIAAYNWAPNTPGTLTICAAYTPSVTAADPYGNATAGPYLLSVNQPAVLSVSVPAETRLRQTLPFTFYLPTPNEQTAPTGTISLYDPNCNSEFQTCNPNYGLLLGTVNVTGGGVYGPLSAALSTTSYIAVYSGDANYELQTYYGTLLIQNGLISISPAAVTPAASTTTTFTLTGPGINSTSLVGIGNASGPSTYITPTGFNLSGPIPQLTFVFPSTLSVGEESVYLEIHADTDSGYATTGGPLSVQVYNQYTDTVTDSTGPTVAYGSANFNATVTRGLAVTGGPTTDAAVPAGTVNFTLNGTGGNSYSSAIGSATLSQVSTQGTYMSPFFEPMDTNGSAKLVSADLNGDGYADVVGLPGLNYGDGASGAYLQVMLSTGYNAFQSEQQVFTGCEAQDFGVGDINNDLIPDLVVICFVNDYNYNASSPLQAYYMLGNGDGTFQAPVAFGGNTNFISPTNVVLGQFNNDGYLDIAVIDGFKGIVQVISPFGDSVYGPQINFDLSNGQVVTAGAADFNQDGYSDLAIEESNYSTSGALLILLSDGNGYFYTHSETQFFAYSSYMQGMTIADVDGDGYPDVAITDPGGRNEDSGNIFIFENDKYGDLPLTFTYSAPGGDSEVATGAGAVAGVPFPTIGQPATGAAVAPGWNLVYTYVGSNNDLWVAEIQRNNATSWSQITSFDTNSGPFGSEGGPFPDYIVTGDMNGDGYLDFTINGTTESIEYELQPWYYSNDSQASLTGSLPFPLPPPGVYNLTASYPGSQLYQPNNGNISVTIGAATPTGSLTVNPSSGPYAYGTSLTFNASVIGVTNGVAPSGTVNFTDGGSPFDTENLNIPDGGTTSTATSVTSLLAPGTHKICITYSGDSNYNAVQGNLLACTNVTISAFSLSLTSTATYNSDSQAYTVTAGTVMNLLVQGAGATLPYGQTITLTGLPTAAPVTPTTNGIGVASYNFGLFPPGTYTIQADFVPLNTNPASPLTSNTITVQVSDTPVNVALSPSANPITYPTLVNLTANATSNGLGVPTGTISFENNGSPFGSGGLSNVTGSSGLTYSGIIDPNPELTDRAVVTGDFNGDGNPDLAVLPGNSGGTLLISLGNGDGTFQAAKTFTVDSTAVTMAVADFNKDQKDDLVIANSDGTVSVYLSSVTGGVYNLGLSQNVSVTGAIGVATGDFNDDGFQDFAVISSTQVLAFLNNGAANFPSAGSWSTTSESSQYAGITVADFNQDHYADIAVSDNSGPDVAVFLYNPDGGFMAPSTYSAGMSASAIASGDINGDGYPDLAVVSNSDSTVAVLINNGSSSPGTFNAANSYGIAYQPTAIAMNDFNQDGYADIAVVGTGVGAGTGTTILLGSLTGNMYGETSLPTTGGVITTGLSIATADFNEDGNPDLVVGNNGASIFLDTGAQASLAGVALQAGTAPLTGVYSGSEVSFTEGTSQTLNEVVNQAVPTITWSNPTAISYGTALSATQLNATASFAGTTVPGTFTYTPALGTVLGAGTHQLAVSFVPNEGSTDFTGNTATVSITVNQAATSINWSNPAAITYGVALSGTQLNATVPIPGTLTYTPPLGTVLTAGIHQLSVDFVPTDSIDYAGATGSVTINVNQAVPSVTWSNPAAITYGTTLSGAQLNATSSVPGSFTYTPAAGTALTAGTHQLSVSFVPTDNVDYAVATGSVSISVNQATPSISWTPPAPITYGTALSAAQLTATSSIAGSFAYNPAAGSILTAGPHTLSVTFTPTDTTDYTTATTTVQLAVNQAAPSITWTPPAAITYGTALSATQLAASTPVAGTFAYNPLAGTVLTAGPHILSVTFTPTDTTDYTTATSTVPLTVNQATPAITWAPPAAITYGTQLSATQLNATATPSGGTFTYSPPAGSTLPEGTQTLSVTYVPTDSTDYAVATASVTIQVNSTSTTLDLVSSTTSTTAGSVVTFQVQANGSAVPAGQTVTLTGLPTAATVNLTLNGDGFASYSYGLFSPGTYTVQASLANNPAFAAATSNTVSLNVAPAAVKVALASSANPVTYPTPVNLTANVSSSGLGVPTGSISFQDNGIQVGSGTLATVNGSSGLASVGTLDSVTGQTVIAVVTGDFNKDGNQDIAALESGSGVATLLVSLGNGDGTFQAPVTYTSSVGIDPTSVAMAAADFNGDGYTDLVLAASDGNVVVLMAAGNAAGDLAISQELEESGLLGVATGDFNKDGNQDFAVISSNTITVFYGTGSTPSNFQYAGSWSATFNSSSFTGITVADFNHDGYADIAVSDNAGPDAAVFLYNSGGSGFTGPQTYTVSGSANAIASGDINGDGYPDLAVVSTVNSTVDVLINDGSGGSGTFPGGTIYGVGSQPAAIAMNDFNKDGYFDIAVAGTGTGQGGGTTILLGSSSGAITGEASLAAVYGQSIASADFNNDGNPDLVVGLNGIAEFLDSAAQTVATNIVLTAGTQPLTAVYSPSTASTFAASTSPAVSEVVSPVGLNITWPSPAAITYGTALSSAQLDATAPVPGTFTYAPPLGSILSVGTQQLSVTFVPTDSADYVSATASVSISITPAPTTVSWSNPAGISYGTALTSTQLDATASVPGTYNYSPALGTVLTAGAHQLSVSFVPNDTLDYLGSTATATIVVSQASSTITWPPPASIAYGTPLSAAQFDATATVPGSFAYTPVLGTILTAGSHTLTAVFTPTDSTDYATTTSTVSITVNRANPSIVWTAPAAITYGTALGASQLDATPSTPGTLTYNPAAGTILGAGPQTLNVSFTPTDTTDYNSATASVPIQVNQATPVITWSNPAAIGYGIQLSATQLNATALPAGGVFTYTPPVGTVLPVGTQTLRATYTPADTIDYATASASVTIQVNPGLTFTSVSPSSGVYQSPNTSGTPVSVTLNGTGFSPNAVVQLAWASGPTTLSTSYIGPDELTATIPGSFFQQTQPGAITITNPSTGQTSASIPFTVTLPNIQIVFTGPGSESEAQQPSLNLQFLDGYPVPLQVTLSLAVQPAAPGGPVDPSVQFSTGGTTYSFTQPANSTTAPTIQLQTGTLAGTITVTLTLEANDQDVTPAGLQPVVIVVPASAPVLTSISLIRSGNTLTVTVQGYSSTREISSALFNFTPAAGQALQESQLTVDVATDFSTWYTQPSSNQYGSAFSYTQAFDLSSDASTVGGVSVTLTNSVGTSNVETAN